MKRLSLIIACLSIGFLWANPQWEAISNRHFTILYSRQYEQQATLFMQTIEQYREPIEKLTGNSRQHVPFVIQDIGVISNGSTDPINNKIQLYLYGPTDSELAYMTNWWAMVGPHEYIHMLHITNSSKIPGFLARYFSPALHSNLWVPSWVIEGITVYGESQFSPYQGRLNEGYYQAIVQAQAKENEIPTITQAAYARTSFPYGGYYVYGGNFFRYLAQTYGEDKFAVFFQKNGATVRSYINPIIPSWSMDRIALSVYGKTFPQLWDEWREQESRLAISYELPENRVSCDGWMKTALQEEEGKVYYIREYPVKTDAFQSFHYNQIVEKEVATAKERVLANSNAGFVGGFQRRGDCLYYAELELGTGFLNAESGGNGYYAVLKEKNLRTAKERDILQDEIRSYAIMPDGHILYARDRKSVPGSQIIDYNPETDESRLLTENEWYIGAIIPYKDKIYVNARKDGQNLNIGQLDLTRGTVTLLFPTPYQQQLASIDEDKMIFTSNQEGWKSVYWFDRKHEITYKLSKHFYANSPALSSDGQTLYVIGVNNAGDDVYSIPLAGNMEAVDIIKQEPSDSITAPVMEVATSRITLIPVAKEVEESSPVQKTNGDWLNLKKLLIPSTHYPLIKGTTDSLAIGFGVMGSDLVGYIPSWSASILYDTKVNRYIGSATVQCLYWQPVSMLLHYEDIDNKLLYGDFSLPLYNKLHYGINKLIVGSLIQTRDDYIRKEIIPYVQVGMSSGYLQQSTRFEVMIERKNHLKSDRDRLGYRVTSALKEAVLGGELRNTVVGVYDPDENKGDAMPLLRGYDDALLSPKGIASYLTYSRLFFKWRAGLWSPQFYLDDVFASVFSDLALGTEEQYQWSIGTQVQIESYAAFLGEFLFGIRLSINKDDSSLKQGFFFGTNF